MLGPQLLLSRLIGALQGIGKLETEVTTADVFVEGLIVEVANMGLAESS